MTPGSSHGGTVAGTATGTLLAVVANIHTGDLVKTAVLSCVGALMSFVVSLLLKWAARRMGRKRQA